MLVTLVATIPPTLASLAAWWGVRGGPAWRERIEAQLQDLLDWQVEHNREHKTNVFPIRRRGGQQ